MSQTVTRRKNRDASPLNQELIERLRACIQDEWPLRQIEETFGVSHRTMKKYFPHYSGEMDYKLCGEISELTKKVGL